VKGVAPAGKLYQKVEIFDIWGCIPTPMVVSEITYTVSSGTLNSTIPYHTHSHVAIEVKFCTAKRTLHVPIGCAKFDVNRFKESPLRCEKNPYFFL